MCDGGVRSNGLQTARHWSGERWYTALYYSSKSPALAVRHWWAALPRLQPSLLLQPHPAVAQSHPRQTGTVAEVATQSDPDAAGGASYIDDSIVTLPPTEAQLQQALAVQAAAAVTYTPAANGPPASWLPRTVRLAPRLGCTYIFSEPWVMAHKLIVMRWNRVELALTKKEWEESVVQPGGIWFYHLRLGLFYLHANSRVETHVQLASEVDWDPSPLFAPVTSLRHRVEEDPEVGRRRAQQADWEEYDGWGSSSLGEDGAEW